MRSNAEWPRCLSRWRYFLSGVAVAIVILAAGEAHPEPGRIVARLGPGSNPVWSPDGRYIAFVRGGTLLIKSSGGEDDSVEAEHGTRFSFVWSSDTSLVFGRFQSMDDTLVIQSAVFSKSEPKSESGRDTRLRKVSGNSELVRVVPDPSLSEYTYGPVRLVDGTVGHMRFWGSSLGPAVFLPLRPEDTLSTRESNWPVLFTREDGERFSPPWGEIWMKHLSTPLNSAAKRLTENELFGFIRVAPAGDRFVALSLIRQAWVVFDTSGQELVSRLLPRHSHGQDGIIEGAGDLRWSPDSQRFSYILSIESPENVLAQKLFVCRTDGTNATQILSEEHGDVRGHEWSPDGTCLAVTTQRSGLLIVETK